MQKQKPPRSEKHRRYVSKFLCCACTRGVLIHNGTVTSQAAHVDIKNESGMGLKAGDQYTVPLCREHHDEYDGRTKGYQGPAFWSHHSIRPESVMRELVAETPCPRYRNMEI
jgi:hypothetical protein